MVSMLLPVGAEPKQVPLQTPIFTEPPTTPPTPPGANGRSASATAGTVMVRIMLEGLTTFTEKLLSATSTPPTTIPTLVLTAGFAPATNPAPDKTTGNELPATAVGRVPGESPLMLAPGAATVRLMVTTVTEDGLP